MKGYRNFNTNNRILVAVCIILILAIFKEMQFLAVFMLFLGLLLIYPKIASNLPRIITEVIKEIRIGKSSIMLREPYSQAEVESKVSGVRLKVGALNIFNEANKLLSSGKFSEAVEKYKETMRIDDSFPHVHLNLGAAYLGLWHQTTDEQDLKNSIKASKEALKIDPGGYRSRINLAVAYSKMREKEPEALKLYDEADEKGDLRDQLTWGKVKLFKAGLILTLSRRPEGRKYESRLPEAEMAVLESLRLFEMAGKRSETSQWIRETTSLLDLIKKQLKAIELRKTPRKKA